MKQLGNLLLVVGFCTGTLGAAGFQKPARLELPLATPLTPEEENLEGLATERASGVEDDGPATEQYAWLLFAGGFVVMTAGAALGRSKANDLPQAGEAAHLDARAVHLARIAALGEAVAGLASEAPELAPSALRQRIEEVQEGPLFEVTAEFEETLAVLGFSDYAAVWDGVATGERLLNRAWSMLTDGHADEAREELRLARASFERAVAAG